MAGLDAFGVILERETEQGSGVYEAIANITDLGGPSIEREQIDVTAHDSPDQWEEFVFGIKRSGEISADVNYDPTIHDTLLDDFESPFTRGYRVIWPDPIGTVWSLQAGLVGFEPEAPHDDKLAASLTWKVSGPPNFDDSAS